MICSCHALCQGRTNARFLVQGLFEKADCMDHYDVSDQQAKNLIWYSISRIFWQVPAWDSAFDFFFFLSYNSMVNYTRIYRGISTSFKMFNKKSVYNNFWGTYTSEWYFMQHPLSLPTYKYCFLGDLYLDMVVVVRAMGWCPGEQNQSTVVLLFVTENVYFLSPSDKRKMIWGAGRREQLLNIVKKFHRPKETIKRKLEMDLYHEIESYFW